jgi:hypothetical protein
LDQEVNGHIPVNVVLVKIASHPARGLQLDLERDYFLRRDVAYGQLINDNFFVMRDYRKFAIGLYRASQAYRFRVHLGCGLYHPPKIQKCLFVIAVRPKNRLRRGGQMRRQEFSQIILQLGLGLGQPLIGNARPNLINDL